MKRKKDTKKRNIGIRKVNKDDYLLKIQNAFNVNDIVDYLKNNNYSDEIVSDLLKKHLSNKNDSLINNTINILRGEYLKSFEKTLENILTVKNSYFNNGEFIQTKIHILPIVFKNLDSLHYSTIPNFIEFSKNFKDCFNSENGAYYIMPNFYDIKYFATIPASKLYDFLNCSEKMFQCNIPEKQGALLNKMNDILVPEMIIDSTFNYQIRFIVMITQTIGNVEIKHNYSKIQESLSKYVFFDENKKNDIIINPFGSLFNSLSDMVIYQNNNDFLNHILDIKKHYSNVFYNIELIKDETCYEITFFENDMSVNRYRYYFLIDEEEDLKYVINLLNEYNIVKK